MTLIPHYRLGFGFDIEHNDNICHVVGDEEGRFVVAFEGLIIKISFFTFYLGEFSELDPEVLEQED